MAEVNVPKVTEQGTPHMEQFYVPQLYCRVRSTCQMNNVPWLRSSEQPKYYSSTFHTFQQGTLHMEKNRFT